VTEQLPEVPGADALRQQAEATIESYRAFLESPAFQHSIDLAVLVKIAGDDAIDIRERRRAAEVLAKLRLQAMSALAELTGAREQALDRLGLQPNAQPVALTQINQRIEIVRANDWRGAQPLPEGQEIEVEVLPVESAHESNGHATNGHAASPEEVSDADDPPA